MIYNVGPKWDRRVVELNPLGNIALLMSGGIDSFVLYNLLHSHNVTVINVERQDGYDNYLTIEKLIGRKITRLQESVTESNQRILNAVDQCQSDYDQVYIGLTRNPPFEYFPEFAKQAPKRPWKLKYNSKVVAPFLHIHKYHVIELAQQLNIDLTNTLSCLVDKSKNCGNCWQCKERKWGFDQLNEI